MNGCVGGAWLDSQESQGSSCFLYLGELQCLPMGNGNTRYTLSVLLLLVAWEPPTRRYPVSYPEQSSYTRLAEEEKPAVGCVGS